jgi:hypothetical protein
MHPEDSTSHLIFRKTPTMKLIKLFALGIGFFVTAVTSAAALVDESKSDSSKETKTVNQIASDKPKEDTYGSLTKSQETTTKSAAVTAIPEKAQVKVRPVPSNDWYFRREPDTAR